MKSLPQETPFFTNYTWLIPSETNKGTIKLEGKDFHPLPVSFRKVIEMMLHYREVSLDIEDELKDPILPHGKKPSKPYYSENELPVIEFKKVTRSLTNYEIEGMKYLGTISDLRKILGDRFKDAEEYYLKYREPNTLTNRLLKRGKELKWQEEQNAARKSV